MKPNPTTGEFLLASGVLLSPHSSRTSFLSSVEGAQAKVLVKNEPWCSFHLSAGSSPLSVSVYFKGEFLDSIHFSVSGAEYGSSWGDWSEEKEMKRKSANDAWLQKYELTPGQTYSWGSVWSGYDPKGGFSSIVVRYAPRS